MSLPKAILVLAMSAAVSPAGAGPALDRIRHAHSLACGVITEPADWNKADLHGNLSMLDTQICRAIAAAVLARPDAAAIRPFAVEQDGLAAVSTGRVDVVVGVTPTAGNLGLLHIWFGPPVFYDAQAIIAHKSFGIARLEDLDGKKLCYAEDGDNAAVVTHVLTQRGIHFIPFPFQEESEMESGLLVGHCQAMGATLSKIAEIRAQYGTRLADIVVLPDVFSLLPVAPAYAQGDPQFAAIVDWTIYALVQAEIGGVTQANVMARRNDPDPETQRLLGGDWSAAQGLGLPHDWAVTLIGAVGNYGEIFARTVGGRSAYAMPMGLNAPWTKGGLMTPLPIK